MSARQVSRLRGFVTRLRWYEVGPELLLTAGLGLFAATEPHAAGSAFRSNKATVVMVTVALGWIAIRTATLAVVHWPVVRVALFTAAAIAILKVVVLPAYTDHTVIEAHPIQATASATSVPPPDSASADVQRAPALATGPVRERSGPFRGIDHRAVGTVNVYRQTDGHVVVGLENFDIQPGPAYALYLVPGTDRRDHDRGSRLGRLRGNKGTQFYDAPAALDVGGGPWTVLVWCETFDVPVANATPTSV